MVMPIPEAVAIPTVAQHLDESKTFRSNDLIDASVKPALDELHRWAEALKAMRS